LAAVLAVAIAVAGVTPSRADYVKATFSDVNPGEVVTITTGAGTSSATSATGWAGFYNFTNASGYLSGNLKAFCIDVSQDINQNQTVTFNVADLANAPDDGAGSSTFMGTTKANLIRELWYRDYGLAGLSNSNAAAFQIAIWKIINETDSTYAADVTQGTFTVSDNNDKTTLTTANKWLSGLTGKGPDDSYLIALTNSTYQDYVVEATPTPPGLLLGAIGLLSLLPVAWRHRKQFPLAAAA
jgi:hypothetical protein